MEAQNLTKVICIVDDQPSLRQLLCYALNIQGVKVLEAENGVDALEVISSQPVDMLVVDWQMPKMDGLELVRCLRKKHDYVDLPVVIISCREDLEARAEARSLGVISWLKKPFRIAELQTMVENTLIVTSRLPESNEKPAGTGLR